jgi:hypothetical protein
VLNGDINLMYQLDKCKCFLKNHTSASLESIYPRLMCQNCKILKEKLLKLSYLENRF